MLPASCGKAASLMVVVDLCLATLLFGVCNIPTPTFCVPRCWTNAKSVMPSPEKKRRRRWPRRRQQQRFPAMLEQMMKGEGGEEEEGGREAEAEAEEAHEVLQPPPLAGGAGVRGPRAGDLLRRLLVREPRETRMALRRPVHFVAHVWYVCTHTHVVRSTVPCLQVPMAIACFMRRSHLPSRGFEL